MSSSMQNMKTTTMTWHTFTALIRSFLPMSRKNITTIMMRKNTIARTSMARKDTIIITMMKNITARISMAKRAIIMIMTTFMAITTIMNTAIWRMSWRSLTALP